MLLRVLQSCGNQRTLRTSSTKLRRRRRVREVANLSIFEERGDTDGLTLL